VLTAEPSGYRFPGYTLDLVRGCLRDGGREIKLRPQTFKVLTYFVSNAGRLLPKDELIEAVWAGLAVTDDSLVQCVKEIRRAIDDSAQVLIKTIPGRGYLFDLPVEMVEPKRALGAEPELSTAATSERTRLPAWLERIRALDWRFVAAAILVLVLVSGGIGWWVRAPVPPQVTSTAATAPPRLSIVVLPFTNLSGDLAQDYFADGVTDNLTTDLSTHISGLFVISRNTAFTFKGKNVDVQQLGRDLGVHYVLEGSVQRSEDQVRVNAQLVDAQSGAHFWAERFQEERRELFALEDRITGRIANSLGVQLVQAAARDASTDKSDPDAADLVMRGRAFLSLPESLENLNQAETLFRQALAIDDRNIDALTGLSLALTGQVINFGGSRQDLRESLIKESEDVIDKAVAIDPKRSEAHFARGVALRAQRRNLESAREYEIAISGDPSNATAHAFLGAAMFRLGQPEKSIPLIEHAMHLSPRDPQMSVFEWQLGTAHMFLRHDDLAIEWFSKARAENPNYLWILRDLGAAYALKGDAETARKLIAEVLKTWPNHSIARLRFVRDSDDPEYLRLREETLYKGLRIAGLPEQ